MGKENEEKKVNLVIECKTDCEMCEITIDGERIYCNRKTTLELERGKTYLLEWTVMGEEGCEYSIKILEPPNIEFEIKRKLDSKKRDTGQHYIEIPVSDEEKKNEM